MRVCQPSPVALNAASTSASNRIVVLTLVPLPAGLPRRFPASARPSSRDTTLSPIRHSPSSKKSSGSSSASSGSTQVPGEFCNFTFICFPHTDTSSRSATLRPNYNNHPSIKIANRHTMGFAVVQTVVVHRYGNPFKHLSRTSKIQASFDQCLSTFAGIESKSH
jgi:hypothetical protein